MRRKRRLHKPEFKAKVALAAIKGEMTMAEMIKKFDVQAPQISQWKKQLLDVPRSAFYHAPVAVSDEELELMRLIDQCYL